MSGFLHGVQVVEIDNGTRPIRTVKSSVIGVVGTAPDADATAFPLNTPVLIAGRRTEAAKLDTTGNGLGTLPAALDGIFDQAAAMVVVIRVAVGVAVAADPDATPPVEAVTAEEATKTNIIGGVDGGTGAYTGISALLGAKSTVHVTPRILIAPGYADKDVIDALTTVAERLRAVVVADGTDTTDAEAVTFRGLFASPRVFVVDPYVSVWDTATSTNVIEPPSARVAGLIAKTDNDRGFWWSPSNKEILGINGTSRPIDFALGDANARANHLNENEVATIIQENGFRLWGNRTCSSDPKWAFLSVRRTADMINDSILRAHLWAVDRGITRTYVEDVAESVNAYLRHLKQMKAILGGAAWADPEANTPDQIEQGKITFDFDFTPPYPAERITFRSRMVNDYVEEIF